LWRPLLEELYRHHRRDLSKGNNGKGQRKLELIEKKKKGQNPIERLKGIQHLEELITKCQHELYRILK